MRAGGRSSTIPSRKLVTLITIQAYLIFISRKPHWGSISSETIDQLGKWGTLNTVIRGKVVMIATQVKFLGYLKYVICEHNDLFKNASKYFHGMGDYCHHHVVLCFVFINKLLGTMTAYVGISWFLVKAVVSAFPAHRDNCVPPPSSPFPQSLLHFHSYSGLLSGFQRETNEAWMNLITVAFSYTLLYIIQTLWIHFQQRMTWCRMMAIYNKVSVDYIWNDLVQ